MSETWLKENPHLLDYVKIPGYTTFFNYRNANRRGGGVGAYVKEGLKCKIRKDIMSTDSDFEHLWLEF